MSCPPPLRCHVWCRTAGGGETNRYPAPVIALGTMGHHGTQGEPRGNPGLSQQSSSAPGSEHFCYTHFDKNPMIRPTDQADVPAPTLIILHLPRISPSRTFRDNLSVIIKKINLL